MKHLIIGKNGIKLLCMVFLVGILCTVHNSTVFATGEQGEAVGVSGSALDDQSAEDDNPDRTNLQDPGSTQTRDDLANLNIANNLTISYDDGTGNGQLNGALRILILLTLMSIAPLLLIMLTSFTRVLIVLHFTRAAIGTQTAPPNNILIAISLFLTLFIMSPTFTQVYNDAVVPFEAGEIETEEAYTKGIAPFREFMYKQTQVKDVDTFMQIKGEEWDGTSETVPTVVLIPSFIISELRTSFIIGFLIYIPFIVIDMVVASTLMSMGMMMLPPTTISMPFKILLFVLADGWNLVIMNVVKTFY